jgi:hypothetical protein
MKRKPPSIDAMLWIPGVGPDEKLLRDLAARFPKPSEPLGEAWFMSETRYLYDELNIGGIEAVSDEYLSGAFDEMVGGMTSFYEMDVWAQWYAYITPRILLSSRFLEHPYFIDTMWDGLIALSWYGQVKDVLHYEANFAHALAPIVMHQHFWRDGRFHDTSGNRVYAASWSVYSLSSDFATSMFLSWRYLHPSAIESWLCSVLSIKEPNWRTQFLLWLLQVAPVFTQNSANLSVLSEIGIEIMWPGSRRWLRSIHGSPQEQALELIPRHNIAALGAAITHYFDEATYFAWIDDFSKRPEIWPQIEIALENLPQVLAQLRG